MKETFKFKGRSYWYERLTQISAVGGQKLLPCHGLRSHHQLMLVWSFVVWRLQLVHLCQGCVSVLAGTTTACTETPSHRCRAFALSTTFLQLGQGGSCGSLETHGCAGDREGACVGGKGKAEPTKRVPGAQCTKATVRRQTQDTVQGLPAPTFL